MDFWKYFTNNKTSDKDEANGESADTAVNSLTRTTSRIMISHDDNEEDIHDRFSSSRKRPISSIDGRRDNHTFPSSPYTLPTLTTTTTTTTTTSSAPTPTSTPRINIPNLPSHPTSIPKPIPKPRMPHRSEETFSPPHIFIGGTNEPKYICPYCEEEDLNTTRLIEHVFEQHAGDTTRVVCPICTASAYGDPSYKSSDFQGHLLLRHRDNSRGGRRYGHNHFSPSEDNGSFGNSGILEEGSPYRSLSRSSNSTPSSSGGVVTLWDWLVQQDIAKPSSSPTLQVICFGNACHTVQIKQGEATCVLACGHTFHSSCLEMEQGDERENEDDEVSCPVCNPPVHSISFSPLSTSNPLSSPKTPHLRKKVRK